MIMGECVRFCVCVVHEFLCVFVCVYFCVCHGGFPDAEGVGRVCGSSDAHGVWGGKHVEQRVTG